MSEDKYFIFRVEKDFDLNSFKKLCFGLMKKYKENIKNILYRQYGKNIKMVTWDYPNPHFKNDDEIKNYIEKQIKIKWFDKYGYTGSIHIPFQEIFYPIGYVSNKYVNKNHSMKGDNNFIHIFFGSIAPPYQDEISFIKEIYSIIKSSGAGSTDYDWCDEYDYETKHVNSYDIARIWSVNLFSKKDVEKYGMEKLLNAPAEVIEELPDGAIFMMINKDKFSSSIEQRKKLRDYLNQ